MGLDDLERAADALASRIPEALAPLARIAYDYRWSWLPDGPDVFAAVDADRWARCLNNPVRLLQEAPVEALRRAAADRELLHRVGNVEAAMRADRERPHAEVAGITPDRPVGFFCAEYGFHASLPIYSGGLGALAGDILKEASDRALPLVAVGLLYRQGYFRQRIDASGWQHEYWVDTDADRSPAVLVHGDDGRPVTVTVSIDSRDVVAQVWRVDVGRVPLFLLDAERPENDIEERWITGRLYVGDQDTRLAQYVLLGVGGMRALETLGIDPSLIHLNEGHAAFASLELARHAAERAGTAGSADGFEAALRTAREHSVFTTHTPVPAGNDTFPGDRVARALAGLTSAAGVEPEAIVRLGRTHPDDAAEPFGVTQFALRTSRSANGVSRRHGEVARYMWHALWPRQALDRVPITHVTNGVHIPSWIGAPMRRLLDRHLGVGWWNRADDPATWAGVDGIPDAELWAVREEQRAALVGWAHDRAASDRLGRGDIAEYVRAVDRFSPHVLTLGFARRVATYKRLHLLLQDVGRSVRLLASERPIQILLAGKAHPRDDPGKQFVQALFSSKGAPQIASHVAFLDDYDLAMAARLVQGCDVWVNLPRPPLEASGTSGMKNAVNGGLHLSVLDGWWAEGHTGDNGWALSGDVDADHGAQDARDGAELYRLLEQEVVPAFYERDGDGLPRAWIARVKASLRTNGPAFGAGRMLADYEQRVYAAS